MNIITDALSIPLFNDDHQETSHMMQHRKLTAVHGATTSSALAAVKNALQRGLRGAR